MAEPEARPKPKTLDFEPEYAVEDGVAHTFNGTLYVPTDDEFKRMEAAAAARVEVNPVCLATPAVSRPFPEQWMSRRVKMSAGEMIRLAATKN